MWDERYSSAEYAYGIEANEFLKQNFHNIKKGKVISLAEGEGRNAVFLAQQGYSVTAIDSSIVGLEKARALAKRSNVDIDFIHADINEFDFGNKQWDGIISIFFPLPSQQRQALYKKLPLALKPNGVFFLEAYTPKQVKNNTGGGKVIDVMQSKHSLKHELAGVHFKYLTELERNISEGMFHTGIGSVVQAIAIKTE